MGYDIKRATEENEEVGFYRNDIEEALDAYDVSKILDNNGDLRRDQYKYISGSFTFSNTNNMLKHANVEIRMDNALTEYVIGQLFIGVGVVDRNHNSLAPFKELIHFIDTNICFESSLEDVYLKSLRFTHPKKIFKRGRKEKGRVGRKFIKIINPKSNRIIDVNKGAYKKLYGKIILNKVDYKNLSIYDQIQYTIKNNCAVDLLTEYEKKDINELEKILDRKIDSNISLDELIYLYKYFCMKIRVYDMTHNIYYESSTGECDRYFKIYGDHIYVLSSDHEHTTARKRVINNIKSIDKYKNNKLIVEDKKLFDEIIKKIRDSNIMIEYNNFMVPYRTNMIIYNPEYEIDRTILNDNDSKCRSVHNMINNRIKLTGYMNNETFSIFNTTSKIRFLRSNKVNSILSDGVKIGNGADMNKAYPSQLIRDNIYFGIPNINDYLKVYDGSYFKHGFYYCTLKSYDEILGLCDDIYTYYEIEELKKDNRIKEIKYMFIPSSCVKLSADDIEYLKSIDVDKLRSFIGWLSKSKSAVITKYDYIKNDQKIDIKAIEHYYGEELTKSKNCISINKVYTKKNTGILANILIKALSNIELYKMDKKIKELNEGIKLNSIRTDSLGYYYGENEIKLPLDMFKPGFGYWKIENKKQKVIGDYIFMKKPNEPIITNNKINVFKIDNIDELLGNTKSFIIYGIHGTGKTYNIDRKIIPILELNNKKYIVCSITKENSERINSVTLASLLNGKSDYELKTEFKNYDYMIIDEAQMINQEYLISLDIINRQTNMKFILIGDTNQTKGDGIKINWDNSEFIIRLCEYNKLEMVDSHRCDDKINKLIEELKKIKSFNDIIKFIIENFQTSKDIKLCNVHLCRYKKTLDELTKLNLECHTITQNQGSTINEKYMIHDLKVLPRDQLITALTRATKWDDIHIYY